MGHQRDALFAFVTDHPGSAVHLQQDRPPFAGGRILRQVEIEQIASALVTGQDFPVFDVSDDANGGVSKAEGLQETVNRRDVGFGRDPLGSERRTEGLPCSETPSIGAAHQNP